MRFGSAAAVAIVVSASTGARAQPGPLDLDWDAPAGCPTHAEVLAEVARIAGPSGAGTRVVARVSVREDHGVWRVSLTTRAGEASETRAFDAESCRAAADAAALIVALALNPHAAAAPGAPPLPVVAPPQPPASERASAPPPSNSAPASAPPQPPRETAPAAALPPNAPPARGPSPVPRAVETSSRFPFAIAVSVAGDRGSLPSTAVGGEATAAWVPGRARLEISATYWGGQHAVAAAAPQQGADFSLFGAGARGVYAFRAEAFEAGPFAGFHLERMGASGFGGTASSLSQTPIFASVDAGALAMWSPIPHLALRLAAGMSVPLARPTFVVEEADTGLSFHVHRPAALAGRATLGVEARFF